jgi:hypothetical protein
MKRRTLVKDPKIDQLALAIFDMAESGLLDDLRAQRYPREVAALQNARLIIRQANGIYVPRSQLLGKSEPPTNVDGSARLAPPTAGVRVQLAPPVRPSAPPPRRTLGVRVEQELLDALQERARQTGTDASKVAREILWEAVTSPARAARHAQGGARRRR